MQISFFLNFSIFGKNLIFLKKKISFFENVSIFLLKILALKENLHGETTIVLRNGPQEQNYPTVPENGETTIVLRLDSLEG